MTLQPREGRDELPDRGRVRQREERPGGRSRATAAALAIRRRSPDPHRKVVATERMERVLVGGVVADVEDGGAGTFRGDPLHRVPFARQALRSQLEHAPSLQQGPAIGPRPRHEVSHACASGRRRRTHVNRHHGTLRLDHDPRHLAQRRLQHPCQLRAGAGDLGGPEPRDPSAGRAPHRPVKSDEPEPGPDESLHLRKRSPGDDSHQCVPAPREPLQCLPRPPRNAGVSRRGRDRRERAVDVEHGDETARAARVEHPRDVERLRSRGAAHRPGGRIDDPTRLLQRRRVPTTGTRLIVVSNRAPLEATPGGEGYGFRRTVGGLATALDVTLRERPGLWIAWAGTANDQVLEPADTKLPYPIHAIRLSEREVDNYYGGFANQVLWPLCHIFTTRCVFDPAYWGAYRHVNERFASTVARLAAPTDTVWVNDFHLCLVPGYLRASGTSVRMGLFWHIPFPPPEVFGICQWREELLQGLLGADVIGLQTEDDVRSEEHTSELQSL